MRETQDKSARTYASASRRQSDARPAGLGAQKIRQAGRTLSHETVRRWRANGWRPLVREEHPIDAARAALDDAIPVLTRDPLTTAESFVTGRRLPNWSGKPAVSLRLP
jgi:hypothetical protein